MIDPGRRPLFFSVTVGGFLAILLSVPSLADEPKLRPAAKGAQRASGVIVTVEKDKKQSGKRILTINTAAVWRDWVRDQATQSPRQSARKDAIEGTQSVAAKGEPQDQNLLVKVEVTDDSRIETRFRVLDDETSKGAQSAAASNGRDDPRHAAKPTQFRASDLRSGLFIEVDFRRKDNCNVASAVAVIRPIPPSATSPTNAK
ncbi:MAG: hypothetical protein P4L84_27415 [Isosphaeraceae bacterium]|nr:hypothetical protein [Isosphaeraceae bacterium]